jgi:hypothetical protein
MDFLSCLNNDKHNRYNINAKTTNGTNTIYVVFYVVILE